MELGLQAKHGYMLAVQALGMPAQETSTLEVSTRIYTNHIPDFVQDDLQRLYGHIRSSLPYLGIFKSTDQVSTYVARQGTTTTAILLFRVRGRSITVLNEMICLDAQELQRFAACIFQHFRAAEIIRFDSIKATLEHFPYPVQRGPSEENVVMTLPATPEDYEASLGKKTRTGIKQQMGRLKKDFPDFVFQTYEKEDIDEQLFYELISRKGDRIKAKKRRFNINADHASRLMELARQCGVVQVVWIGGQVAAGKIDFRLGHDQVCEVTVYDPEYNRYSLGMICNFLSISESITKGVKRFHYGAGQNPYKLRLSGIPEEAGQLNVYRSSAHMMRNWDWAAKVWFKMRMFQWQTWLNNHQDSPITRSFLMLFRYRHALRDAWAKIRK